MSRTSPDDDRTEEREERSIYDDEPYDDAFGPKVSSPPPPPRDLNRTYYGDEALRRERPSWMPHDDVLPTQQSPVDTTASPWVKRTVSAAVALLLIASGFGLAHLSTSSDDPVDVPQVAQQQNSAQTQPLPAPQPGEEPVAEVAAALQPSVVQLEIAGGLGSGVIYDEEGFILTAAHVVTGAREVTVRFSDGSSTSGEVLGEDDNTDIAVVKVDADGLDLQPAELAVGVPVRVGQMAVAIGSPFGLDQTVTSGIISAVHRTVPRPDGGSVQDMIQTDAPINPGNSGGALADREGRVIGINDAIRTTTGGNQGLGFAVPIDVAAWVADHIVQGKEVRPSFLGVGGQDPSDGRAGALITSVEPGSAAEEAGIREGDLITSLNGTPIADMADLAARVRSTAPGTVVPIELERDGDKITVEATLRRSSD